MAVSKTPAILSIDGFIDAVNDTLGRADGLAPFTLILGSGFSYPIIPTAREVVQRVPKWLNVDPVSFWKKLNEDLGGPNKVQLGSDDLPDLAAGDLVNRAYSVAMLLGLKSPAFRRKFYRSICDEKRGQINLAHLYLASILYAQDADGAHDTPPWRYNHRFCSTIFATNFDPLLQNALQLVSKLYHMTDRPHTLDIPHDELHDAIHLVYTHGSVHQAQIANTEEEIDRFAQQQAARLPDYLQRHGVIVVGYSGWKDCCMVALERCTHFDHNLYWCDRIHPDHIETQLRRSVYDFLSSHRDNAFYVSIKSAEVLMQRLHQSFGLGLAPAIVENPLPALLDRLRRIIA